MKNLETPGKTGRVDRYAEVTKFIKNAGTGTLNVTGRKIPKGLLTYLFIILTDPQRDWCAPITIT